jgi:hypothetical protein
MSKNNVGKVYRGRTKYNIELSYNIDPDNKVDKSHAVPYRGPRPASDFKQPDKAYRIHKDDLPKIGQAKKGYKSF